MTGNRGVLVLGAMLVIGLGIIAGAYFSIQSYKTMDAEQPKKSESNSESTHSRSHSNSTQTNRASEPGQAGFAAVQEIVRILENDPSTDWSSVRIDRLRKHLIDMNEITLHAQIDQTRLSDGIKIRISGSDQTQQAIQRMVPMHVNMTLNRIDNWHAETKKIQDGVVLTVRSQKNSDVSKIQALGFLGLMVKGSKHPKHHLAIARGQMRYPHQHEK